MDEHDNGDPMNYEEGEETHENDNYMDDKDVVEVVEVNDAGGAPMSEDESEVDYSGTGIPGVPLIEDDSGQAFFGHGSEPIYAVSMLPRANLACSGGGDDKAYLWNYLTGEQIGVLLGHSDSVIDVGFNHDGSYVATAGMDGKVIVSLVPSCEQVCVLDGPNEIVWINWHPRGNVLSAGADDGTVWMWSVPKGVFMGVFSKHEDSVTCGGFSRDGKYVISGSADSSLIFWDPKNYSQVWKMGGGHDERWHKSSVCSFATSQDGRIIATGDEEGFIRLTVAQTGKLVGSLDGHENSVNALHFCPEMNWLVSASSDGKVLVWDLDSGRIRITLSHEEPVSCVVIVDNQHLVTAAGKLLSKWNYKTGQLLKQYKGHQDTILALAANEEFCVSGGDDGVGLVFRQ